jgi:hypothetical protein
MPGQSGHSRTFRIPVAATTSQGAFVGHAHGVPCDAVAVGAGCVSAWQVAARSTLRQVSDSREHPTKPTQTTPLGPPSDQPNQPTRGRSREYGARVVKWIGGP